LFERRRRKPWASINFVASHDGFTLHDIVSYGERHNEANGEDNRDGHGENFSTNWGIEGPTDDPAVAALRERLKRFMLVLLFASQGTPMLLAGDEMGRTQQGNNNAYCQDNEISWVDWKLAEAPANRALSQFIKRLIAVRQAWPVMRCDTFLHGRTEPIADLRDIVWFDEQARELTEAAWHDSAARLLAVRRACPVDGGVCVSLVLMNATDEDREFILPQPPLSWRVLIDSASPDLLEYSLETETVTVGNRAAIILVAVS
jgi:glycogen operon protein